MGTGASSSYIDKASDAELQGILEALPDLARLRPQLRPQLLKALSSVATERTQEKKEKKLRVASELVRSLHLFNSLYKEAFEEDF